MQTTATADQTITQAQQGAAQILDAFNAKAREVAAANGWTVEKAQDVMLRYLRNTDAETAAIVAASVLVTAGTVEVIGTGDHPLRLTGTAIDINDRTARLTTAEGVRDIDLNHVLLVRENGVTTWRRSDSTALDPTRS